MANPMGDLLFPDNPHRRQRAFELYGDIQVISAQFQQLQADRTATVARLKPKVDMLLKKFNIDQPEELQQRLNAALSSEQMERYRQVKATLDTTDRFQTIVSGIVDLFAAVSGVVLGVATLAGLMTGGAALAAAGSVVAILGAVVLILGALEGVVEREKLRGAIHDLFQKRQTVRKATGQLDIVVNWMKTMETWVDTFEPGSKDLDALVSATAKQDYDRWTDDYTAQVLLKMDQDRSSWLDEDPGHPISLDAISLFQPWNPVGMAGGLFDKIFV